MRYTYAIILGSLLFAGSAWAAGPRSLDYSADAKDLKAVAVHSRVGSIKVDAADNDKITVRVTIKPDSNDFLGLFKWTDADSQHAVDTSRIESKIEGGTLKLLVVNDTEDSHPGEEWIVTMPARLKTTLEQNVGEVELDGIAGGVDATVNTGKAQIFVPAGSVHVTVNVGKADVFTAAQTYHSLDLSANVGSVSVSPEQAGHEDNEPSGAGAHMHLSGDGTDDFNISVNVGKAALHLGRTGMDADDEDDEDE